MLHYIEPNWDGVQWELELDRRGCGSYRKRNVSRPPKEHIAIEDQNSQRRFQGWLASLSFVGALLGAITGRACQMG